MKPNVQKMRVNHNAEDTRRFGAAMTEISVNMNYMLDLDAAVADGALSADTVSRLSVMGSANLVPSLFRYRAAAICQAAIKCLPAPILRLQMNPFNFAYIEETSIFRLWLLAEWRDRDIFYMRWNPNTNMSTDILWNYLTLTSEIQVDNADFWEDRGVVADVAPFNHTHFCRFGEAFINDLINMADASLGGRLEIIASDTRWVGHPGLRKQLNL